MNLTYFYYLLSDFLNILRTNNKYNVYSNLSLYSVIIKDASDKGVVYALQKKMGVDIWRQGVPGYRPSHVAVDRRLQKEFVNELVSKGINVPRLSIPDVAQAIHDSEVELNKYRATHNDKQHKLFFDYPRYKAVNDYMQEVASHFKERTQLVHEANSFEERPIFYMQISKTKFADQSKPLFLVTALLHAREWITVPAALYMIHRLVENVTAEENKILDHFDWIILPLVNPDGYEYSHEHDRLWHRTRSVNHYISKNCVGVDANRNFDADFRGLGTSTDPCSNLYSGSHPVSEPETMLLRNILKKFQKRLLVYLDLHAHGSCLLYESWPRMNVTIRRGLTKIGKMMTDAMNAKKTAKAFNYLLGNIDELSLMTPGSVQEYALKLRIPFNFRLEMADFNKDFLVPPEELENVAIHTWAGVLAGAKEAIHYYNAHLHHPGHANVEDADTLPHKKTTPRPKPKYTKPLPGTVPDATPDTKPEEKPETLPEGFPETKPDGMPETKPDGMPETKPGGIPETKPDGMPETKPGGIPETKPDGMPETKPGGMPETKPGGMAEIIPQTTREPVRIIGKFHQIVREDMNGEESHEKELSQIQKEILLNILLNQSDEEPKLSNETVKLYDGSD